MSEPTFEWEGKTYMMTSPKDHNDSCSGCAFEFNAQACEAANAVADCVLPDREWVELRRAPASDSKPTNPKDAIGIRKAPMSCLPMGVVAEMGTAMLEGAAKYGKFNYRAVGVRSSVYFDATMRHLISWWEGEDTDPDSGLSHVTKALVSLAVLRDAMMQNMCTDDRPPSSAPFYPALNVKAGEILDKHADKNPRHYTIQDTQQ